MQQRCDGCGQHAAAPCRLGAPTPTTLPLPPTAGRRYSTGRFYCGESDNIVQRLRQHGSAGCRKEGAASLQAAYVVVPDKGSARELQKHVIAALAAGGTRWSAARTCACATLPGAARAAAAAAGWRRRRRRLPSASAVRWVGMELRTEEWERGVQA